MARLKAPMHIVKLIEEIMDKQEVIGVAELKKAKLQAEKDTLGPDGSNRTAIKQRYGWLWSAFTSNSGALQWYKDAMKECETSVAEAQHVQRENFDNVLFYVFQGDKQTKWEGLRKSNPVLWDNYKRSTQELDASFEVARGLAALKRQIRNMLNERPVNEGVTESNINNDISNLGSLAGNFALGLLFGEAIATGTPLGVVAGTTGLASSFAASGSEETWLTKQLNASGIHARLGRIVAALKPVLGDKVAFDMFPSQFASDDAATSALHGLYRTLGQIEAANDLLLNRAMLSRVRIAIDAADQGVLDSSGLSASMRGLKSLSGITGLLSFSDARYTSLVAQAEARFARTELGQLALDKPAPAPMT